MVASASKLELRDVHIRGGQPNKLLQLPVQGRLGGLLAARPLALRALRRGLRRREGAQDPEFQRALRADGDHGVALDFDGGAGGDHNSAHRHGADLVVGGRRLEDRAILGHVELDAVRDGVARRGRRASRPGLRHAHGLDAAELPQEREHRRSRAGAHLLHRRLRLFGELRLAARGPHSHGEGAGEPSPGLVGGGARAALRGEAGHGQVHAEFLNLSRCSGFLARRRRRGLRGQLAERQLQLRVGLVGTLLQQRALQRLLEHVSLVGLKDRDPLQPVCLEGPHDELLLMEPLPLRLLGERGLALLLSLLLLLDPLLLELLGSLLLLLLLLGLLLRQALPLLLLLLPELRLALLLLLLCRLPLFPLLLGLPRGALRLRRLLRQLPQALGLELLGGQLAHGLGRAAVVVVGGLAVLVAVLRRDGARAGAHGIVEDRRRPALDDLIPEQADHGRILLAVLLERGLDLVAERVQLLHL
mmetsp:Transcript_123586/g.357410  ORF Transcript_123586/g.357410 Transcript_123586/m.357410 type:complete len:474 (-) Transcript_123586:1296-2717(-)